MTTGIFLLKMELNAEVPQSGSPTESEVGTRRPSETSFEAWVPQFSGLHRPKGIDILTPFEQFFFKRSEKPEGKLQALKSLLNHYTRIEVYGKGRLPILIGVRKRTVLHPILPPISVYNFALRKIITVDSFKGLKRLWENSDLEVFSSLGLIGIIRFTSTNGVKTYEILDSYSQLVFSITPNLAPHPGLQLLILGAERPTLTGAIFQRRDDFSLEVFKPLSPTLKALLVSFSLFIIFSNVR